MSESHDQHQASRVRSSSRKANRLSRATSPYLLQHALNPVDWYPWGNEAFDEARARNVPIFLSIGYSTCYWCHVMERESFEDEATARVLNARCVSIKLDREERPDLDELYMAATLMMRGQGGWPMSVFLEPDTLRPFYCGTYFPKDARYRGVPTFVQVVEGMSDAFATQRDAVREQAAQLAHAVGEHVAAPQTISALGAHTVEEALSRVLAMLDKVHGGFGTAPKFPQPVFLEFLLDVREMARDQTRAAIDQAVRLTLDKMAQGGIHDHLAGGFHRYSVDATWTVPHFEKMLYDQAQLLSVYARAASIYDDAWYGDVARAMVGYVRSELADPAGGLWSAQDAEVDGREGRNYVWTPQQVREALIASADDASFALDVFGLHEGTNFQDPHHPDEPASNVLRFRERPEAAVQRLGISRDEFSARMRRVRRAMHHARRDRRQPHTDDKLVTSWNGLMHASLARAAALLRDDELAAWTTQSLRATLARVWRSGTLLRTARGEQAHTPGFLEDSAAMIRACIACQMTQEARQLLDAATHAFSHSTTDEPDAASRDAFPQPTLTCWFDTRDQQPDVFVRGCATHDGAVPSGFAMMLHALLDCAHAADPGSREGQALAMQALSSLQYQSGRIAASPAGCVESVRALLRLLSPASAFAPLLQQVMTRGASALRDAAVLHRSPAPGSSTTASSRPQSRKSVASGVDAVQIFASVERLTISQDAPAQCTLVVQIEPGYHVIAADPFDGVPGDMPLVPFRIDVHAGTGVAAYADYPAGTLLSEVSGMPGVRAYAGRLEIPVVLERTGAWSGAPLLLVRFQACSDMACQPPTTVELDIALDRG